MDQETLNAVTARLERIRPGTTWSVDHYDRGSYNDAEAPTKNPDGSWNFTVSTNGWSNADTSPLTFAELDAMSAMFDTNEINFTNEARSSGYCETCYEEWEALVITFKNAKV